MQPQVTLLVTKWARKVSNQFTIKLRKWGKHHPQTSYQSLCPLRVSLFKYYKKSLPNSLNLLAPLHCLPHNKRRWHWEVSGNSNGRALVGNHLWNPWTATNGGDWIATEYCESCGVDLFALLIRKKVHPRGKLYKLYKWRSKNAWQKF